MSIQKKWRNIRDSFVKAHKAKETKSGSAAKKKTAYIFYENLLFLKDTVTVNTTTGNATTESEDTQNEEILPSNSSRAAKRKKNEKKSDDLIGRNLVGALKRKERKRVEDDEDRLFFLSLVKEFKKIPEDMQIQTKLDLLKVIKDAQVLNCPNIDYPRPNSYREYVSAHYSGSDNSSENAITDDDA